MRECALTDFFETNDEVIRSIHLHLGAGQQKCSDSFGIVAHDPFVNVIVV